MHLVAEVSTVRKQVIAIHLPTDVVEDNVDVVEIEISTPYGRNRKLSFFVTEFK